MVRMYMHSPTNYYQTMKTTRILLSLVLMVWAIQALADSPLTSCDIHEAYPASPMVQQALKYKEMTPTIMNFLADKNRPIGERAAVVNALGWDIDSTPWSKIFCEYLCSKVKAKNENDMVKKLDPGTRAVYAYARAMSNYFNVDEAMAIAQSAVNDDKTHSFAINMLSALIAAQHYLDGDWGMVYTVVNNVRNDGSLNLDMKQEAIDIIWDYIKLYEEYSKNTPQ